MVRDDAWQSRCLEYLKFVRNALLCLQIASQCSKLFVIHDLHCVHYKALEQE